MNFLKVYPSVEELFIEFIPDKYIEHQPINEAEFLEKIVKFKKIVGDLNNYCNINRLKQVIVIDCDKCVNIMRLNLVLFARVIRYLAKQYKGVGVISEIQVLHSNQFIKTLYRGLTPLLPSEITEAITLY